MKKLIILSLLLSVHSLQARTRPNKRVHSCLRGNNPICQKLVILKPSMNLDEALRLSNTFHHVARRYRLDPDLLLAIAYQESALTPDAVRKVTGITMDDGRFQDQTVGSDFCMMQINSGNIRKMDLDVERLLSDTDYCIECGARILKNFEKKYRGREEHWWTRYNSCTPAYREMYRKLVTKHLNKILPDPACDSEPADSPLSGQVK